jgi:hypothetical protein
MSDDFARHLTNITKATGEFKLKLSILQNEFENDCVVAQSTGLFRITPEFLAHLSFFADQQEFVVIDWSYRPIKVTHDFIELCVAQYKTACDEYLKKYEMLLLEKNNKMSDLLDC